MRTSGVSGTASWIWRPSAAPRRWPSVPPRSWKWIPNFAATGKNSWRIWLRIRWARTRGPRPSPVVRWRTTCGRRAISARSTGRTIRRTCGSRRSSRLRTGRWKLRDAATDAIVQKTLDLAPRHAAVLGGAGLNTAIRTPIAAARAGRGKELPKVLERYYAAFAPLPNGMSLFEGPTAASVEHLGLLTTTLQESLVQSVSPRPGEPEIIRVFPAWPPEWDASFRLLARGGFLVSSEIRKGKVDVRRNRIAPRRGLPDTKSLGWPVCGTRSVRRPSRI